MPKGQDVVLERNRIVNRRLIRLLGCAGLEVTALEEPDAVHSAVTDQTTLLACDGFDADLVVAQLKAHPRLTAWLWTAEPIDRILQYSLEEPRISNIFGRPSFEATPREWELSLAARRSFSGDQPPFAVHLNWGFTGLSEQPRTTGALHRTVEAVQKFVDAIGC